MQWSEEERAEIKDELADLLVAKFKRKPSLTKLLTYIVEKNLEGHIPTEEEIYQDILRGLFDPAEEKTSKVRTEVSALRGELKEYYARTHEGRISPVAIFIAPKGYALSVDFRDRLDLSQPTPFLPSPSPSSPENKRRFVMIVEGADHKDLARLYPLIIDFLAENTHGEASAILSLRDKASILVELESTERGYDQLRSSLYEDEDELPSLGPFSIGAILDPTELLSQDFLFDSYSRCFVPIPSPATLKGLRILQLGDHSAPFLHVRISCFKDQNNQPQYVECPIRQAGIFTFPSSVINGILRECSLAFVEFRASNANASIFIETLPPKDSPFIIVGFSPESVKQAADRQRDTNQRLA